MRNAWTCIRRNEARRPPGAFTLIEVLLALAVLSIFLVTLLGLQVVSIRLADTAQRVTRASLIAQARMAEALAATDLATGTASGTMTDERQDISWRWERTIADVRPAELETAEVKGLRAVTVRVAWQEGAHERDVVLTAYVAAKEEK